MEAALNMRGHGRRHVHPEHRLPMALYSKRLSAAQHAAWLFYVVELRRHAEIAFMHCTSNVARKWNERPARPVAMTHPTVPNETYAGTGHGHGWEEDCMALSAADTNRLVPSSTSKARARSLPIIPICRSLLMSTSAADLSAL
jgi:hypothetical protein